MGCDMKGFELKSNSFKNEQFLDKKFTCEGEDISPDLFWINAPEGVKSFALICEDPDAPRAEAWVHWIIFNISSNRTSLRENIAKGPNSHEYLETDSPIQGTNDFSKIGYGGPCPPAGKPHRYFFKLYALDEKVPLKSGATKEQLLAAIENHIIAKAELIGLYQLN